MNHDPDQFTQIIDLLEAEISVKRATANGFVKDNHMRDMLRREANLISDLVQQLKTGILIPAKDCPDEECNNQGYVVVRDLTGEPEPSPCEFCHTVPNSRYNIRVFQKGLMLDLIKGANGRPNRGEI